MKISISSRIKTDGLDGHIQVAEMSQGFEETFMDLINNFTSLGEDFEKGDRSETSRDGELMVRYTLALTDEKNLEFQNFSEKLARAMAQEFMNNIAGFKIVEVQS